ncbi:N-acetyltransferase [Dysgonomonas sp. 216]|nr:GNAT family N-acetyltransferase [Dysgonomonas sp. 216]NDW18083.1 N-acetyltransferase [Dysgonomonas sp. 216]
MGFIERIYIESFPPDERRPVNEFRQLIADDNEFSVYMLLNEEERMGFLTYWTFDTFIYAEHFAIVPEHRNGGIGKSVMEAFIASTKLPLILEVEMPDTEMAQRRIGFYKRVGFKLWDISYKQPPYQEAYEALPMMLMTYRDIDLDKDFEHIKRKIYKTVYNVSDI